MTPNLALNLVQVDLFQFDRSAVEARAEVACVLAEIGDVCTQARAEVFTEQFCSTNSDLPYYTTLAQQFRSRISVVPKQYPFFY